MTTTTYTDRERATIESFRENLIDGTTYHYAETAWISGDRLNYSPPLGERDVARVLGVLTDFAKKTNSPRAVDDVLAIIRGLHRYGSAYQFAASLARSIREVSLGEWNDVIAATGPDARRPSAHRHAPTFRYQVALRLLLDDCVAEFAARIGQGVGYGWCLAAIAREEGLIA